MKEGSQTRSKSCPSSKKNPENGRREGRKKEGRKKRKTGVGRKEGIKESREGRKGGRNQGRK